MMTSADFSSAISVEHESTDKASHFTRVEPKGQLKGFEGVI